MFTIKINIHSKRSNRIYIFSSSLLNAQDDNALDVFDLIYTHDFQPGQMNELARTFQHRVDNELVLTWNGNDWNNKLFLSC